MDVQAVFDWAYTFYVHYPIFCYVLAGVFLLLLLWKPYKVLKGALLLLALVVILSVCFYLIGSLNVGMAVKDKAVHRTEKAIEE